MSSGPRSRFGAFIATIGPREQIGAVARQDVRPQQLAAGHVDHELHVPSAIAEGTRLARATHVVAPDLDVVAGLECRWLGEADARKFWGR